MSFEKFIKDKMSTFVAKNTETLSVIPQGGDKTHGKINVKKGDKISVIEHNHDNRLFSFRGENYIMGLPSFSKAFAIVKG